MNIVFLIPQKLGLTWSYVVDVNRSIDSCRYMLTQVVGNTNAHHQKIAHVIVY